MKKRNMWFKRIVSLILCFGCLLALSQPAYAHRRWKKITKLPKGTYVIDREYFEEKPALQKDVKAKITTKYFTLYSAVKRKSNGRIYCSDPLKMKFAKKCKFYNYGETGKKHRISKKRAKKILSYSKGRVYVTLEYFHVKGNRVDKVCLCWY